MAAISRQLVMDNFARVNLGIVAVSRDCFPASLSQKRHAAVLEACRKKNIPVTGIEVLV